MATSFGNVRNPSTVGGAAASSELEAAFIRAIARSRGVFCAHNEKDKVKVVSAGVENIVDFQLFCDAVAGDSAFAVTSGTQTHPRAKLLRRLSYDAVSRLVPKDAKVYDMGASLLEILPRWPKAHVHYGDYCARDTLRRAKALCMTSTEFANAVSCGDPRAASRAKKMQKVMRRTATDVALGVYYGEDGKARFARRNTECQGTADHVDFVLAFDVVPHMTVKQLADFMIKASITTGFFTFWMPVEMLYDDVNEFDDEYSVWKAWKDRGIMYMQFKTAGRLTEGTYSCSYNASKQALLQQTFHVRGQLFSTNVEWSAGGMHMMSITKVAHAEPKVVRFTPGWLADRVSIPDWQYIMGELKGKRLTNRRLLDSRRIIVPRRLMETFQTCKKEADVYSMFAKLRTKQSLLVYYEETGTKKLVYDADRRHALSILITAICLNATNVAAVTEGKSFAAKLEGGMRTTHFLGWFEIAHSAIEDVVSWFRRVFLGKTTHDNIGLIRYYEDVMYQLPGARTKRPFLMNMGMEGSAKPEQLVETQPVPVVRSLTPYTRELPEMLRQDRDLVHSGQNKLYCVEREFLNTVQSMVETVVMIGAGSIGPSHITRLSKDFPKLNFVLYDGGNTMPQGLENVRVVREFVTIRTELRHTIGEIALISDIRQNVDASEVTTLKMDNALQNHLVTWWNPAHSLLKFKAHHSMDEMDAPNGTVIAQPYLREESNELRLWVQRGAPLVAWDLRKLRRQHTWYINNIRDVRTDAYRMGRAIMGEPIEWLPYGDEKEHLTAISEVQSEEVGCYLQSCTGIRITERLVQELDQAFAQGGARAMRDVLVADQEQELSRGGLLPEDFALYESENKERPAPNNPEIIRQEIIDYRMSLNELLEEEHKSGRWCVVAADKRDAQHFLETHHYPYTYIMTVNDDDCPKLLNSRMTAVDGIFDGVVLLKALSEVERPELLIESAKRTLRPGGELMVVDFDPKFVPAHCKDMLDYQTNGRLTPEYADFLSSQLEGSTDGGEIGVLLKRWYKPERHFVAPELGGTNNVAPRVEAEMISESAVRMGFKTVYEPFAGLGRITTSLAHRMETVIAAECDGARLARLKTAFRHRANVTLRSQDSFQAKIPDVDFAVVDPPHPLLDETRFVKFFTKLCKKVNTVLLRAPKGFDTSRLANSRAAHGVFKKERKETHVNIDHIWFIPLTAPEQVSFVDATEFADDEDIVDSGFIPGATHRQAWQKSYNQFVARTYKSTNLSYGELMQDTNFVKNPETGKAEPDWEALTSVLKEELRDLPVDREVWYRQTMWQRPAGGGKSTEIAQELATITGTGKDVIVLCPTKVAVAEFMEKVPVSARGQTKVCTLHRALRLMIDNVRQETEFVLIVDEARLSHPGLLAYAVAHVGAALNKVYYVSDEHQIDFVAFDKRDEPFTKHDVTSMWSELPLDYSNVTHTVPVALLRAMKKHGFYRHVKNSRNCRMGSIVEGTIMNPIKVPELILCVTRQQKRINEQWLKAAVAANPEWSKAVCKTAHEVQGARADCIWWRETEPRSVAIAEKMPKHCLVIATRTREFMFRLKGETPSLPTAWSKVVLTMLQEMTTVTPHPSESSTEAVPIFKSEDHTQDWVPMADGKEQEDRLVTDNTELQEALMRAHKQTRLPIDNESANAITASGINSAVDVKTKGKLRTDALTPKMRLSAKQIVTGLPIQHQHPSLAPKVFQSLNARAGAVTKKLRPDERELVAREMCEAFFRHCIDLTVMVELVDQLAKACGNNINRVMKKGEKYTEETLTDICMMVAAMSSAKNQMKVKDGGAAILKAFQCIIPTSVIIQFVEGDHTPMFCYMLVKALKPKFRMALMDDDAEVVEWLVQKAASGKARAERDIKQMDSDRTEVLVYATFFVYQRLGLDQDMTKPMIKEQMDQRVVAEFTSLVTKTGSTAGHSTTLVTNMIINCMTIIGEFDMQQITAVAMKGDDNVIIFAVDKARIRPSQYDWMRPGVIEYQFTEQWSKGSEWTEFCHRLFNDKTATFDAVYRCTKMYGKYWYDNPMKNITDQAIEYQQGMLDLIGGFDHIAGQFYAEKAAMDRYKIKHLDAKVIVDACFNFIHQDMVELTRTWSAPADWGQKLVVLLEEDTPQNRTKVLRNSRVVGFTNKMGIYANKAEVELADESWWAPSAEWPLPIVYVRTSKTSRGAEFTIKAHDRFCLTANLHAFKTGKQTKGLKTEHDYAAHRRKKTGGLLKMTGAEHWESMQVVLGEQGSFMDGSIASTDETRATMLAC